MYKPSYKLFKTATVEIAVICNVTILVFGFFMLVQKFKDAEPKGFVCWYGYHPPRPIEAISIIGNKVSLYLPTRIRELTLCTMANRYGSAILAHERFLVESSGIVDFPISQSSNYLNAGLPVAPGNPELYQWIYSSRLAAHTLGNDVYLMIKTDKTAQADLILHVAGVLKEQHWDQIEISRDNSISFKTINQLF